MTKISGVESMQKTILLSFAIVVVLLFSSLPAFPQEYPKYEFSGGFSYVGMEQRDWVGWKISGVRNFNHYFGITVDITGLDSSKIEDILWVQYKSDNRRYLFLAGPQFASRSEGNWIPYLRLLMGASMTSISSNLVTRDGEPISSGSKNRNAFAMTLGAGVNYKLRGPFALRLFQADLLHTYGDVGWARGAMISFGLIINQGRGGN